MTMSIYKNMPFNVTNNNTLVLNTEWFVRYYLVVRNRYSMYIDTVDWRISLFDKIHSCTVTELTLASLLLSNLIKIYQFVVITFVIIYVEHVSTFYYKRHLLLWQHDYLCLLCMYIIYFIIIKIILELMNLYVFVIRITFF